MFCFNPLLPGPYLTNFKLHTQPLARGLDPVGFCLLLLGYGQKAVSKSL